MLGTGNADVLHQPFRSVAQHPRRLAIRAVPAVGRFRAAQMFWIRLSFYAPISTRVVDQSVALGKI
jgi:hypothetical protein